VSLLKGRSARSCTNAVVDAGTAESVCSCGVLDSAESGTLWRESCEVRSVDGVCVADLTSQIYEQGTRG